MQTIKKFFARGAVKRAIRTFFFAFFGQLLPGVFGWLNALTEWARAQGQQPFPDLYTLAYLGVIGVSSGFIALLNLFWNIGEDAVGHGVLREVPPKE